jgi:hypothetical protein
MEYCKNIKLEMVENGFTLSYMVKPISDSAYHDSPYTTKQEVFKLNEGNEAVTRMLELSGNKMEEKELEELDEEYDEGGFSDDYDEFVPPTSRQVY